MNMQVVETRSHRAEPLPKAARSEGVRITSGEGSIVWRALSEPAPANNRALVRSSRDKVLMADSPDQVQRVLTTPCQSAWR